MVEGPYFGQASAKAVLADVWPGLADIFEEWASTSTRSNMHRPYDFGHGQVHTGHRIRPCIGCTRTTVGQRQNLPLHCV